MATDTAQKQNDTKPAESPKAATPASSATPAKPAASTQAKTKSKPRAKTAAKSRTRKPAARTARTETATAPAPRTQAKALNGGQQFVAGVIDAQERSVTAIVDYQTRAAELSQIPGATAIAGAQAQVLRGVTDAYVSAARAFLK
jgi:hypothetical protein